MCRFQRLIRAMLCVAVVFCSSCLTMTAPQSAKEDRPRTEAPRNPVKDNMLVDTWELMYESEDGGREKPTPPGVRTLVEFTDQGRVIFNKTYSGDKNGVRSRTATYSLEKNEMHIRDDLGNSVRWPYHVTGDTLVIVMPEAKTRLYLRRSR